jgi:hypothetical protein
MAQSLGGRLRGKDSFFSRHSRPHPETAAPPASSPGTPKGVVPSSRALELEAPVRDALARVRAIVSAGVPFDPRSSRRCFTLGAPDAVSATFLSPMLTELTRAAPHERIMIDATHLKAHRTAASLLKKGMFPVVSGAPKAD